MESNHQGMKMAFRHTFGIARIYAEWREKYLSANPEKRLFPWLKGGFKKVVEGWEEAVEEGGEPITLTPKGEAIVEGIKIKGIVLIAIIALLATSSRE